MKTTYLPDDVTMLLKDITGLVEPLPTETREARIQGGAHYSQMVPQEYAPSSKYIQEYEQALKNFSAITARSIAIVSEKIFAAKGRDVVLVSLARAGTPVGILIKRYLKNKYSINPCHYTISIIRGRGIDHRAMEYMLKRHKGENLQFIDGWVGKGAINNELHKDLAAYDSVNSALAVLADPAFITELCGTHEDFLIPSSCLNSTVSGLISRTFLREDIIKEGDFHGALFYEDLAGQDRSYEFIDAVEKHMVYDVVPDNTPPVTKSITGLEEVIKIAKEFGVSDINFIKPGIGETTRVLLRRVPWKILVNNKEDKYYLGHIFRLAQEKNVPVIEYPMETYRSCGIIKNMSADA